MLDYYETITAFFIDNFSPSNPDNANVKLTTAQLLNFLFRTFPEHCISDYELNDILICLGYNRCTYVAEHVQERKTKDTTVYEIKKSLEIGWCLKSDHDLHTEEVSKV